MSIDMPSGHSAWDPTLPSTDPKAATAGWRRRRPTIVKTNAVVVQSGQWWWSCGSHVFDAPGRTVRGRVITHAFLIQRKACPLPAVRGADEVEKAFWMPLEDIDVQEYMVFDDHVQIIQHFISRLQGLG